MIGIFIGVAAVVALLSLGQGMKDAVTAQFSSLGSDTITVQAAGGGYGPPGSYTASSLGKDDLRVVKRTRGVDEAFGRLIESVRVVVDGKQEFSFIASIADDPDEFDLSMKIPTEFEVVRGRLLRPSDSCKLMIGNDLSTKDILVRKLRVGDKVKVEGTAFDVVGIMKKTGNPQLDRTLYTPESCLRRVVGEDDKFGLLLAKVQEGEDVDTVVDRMKKNLRRSRDVEEGKEDFDVQSSQDVIESINSVLGAVNWFLIGIAAISLLVGAVGITNTMYTAVLERNREIGIMKAIGARNSDVLIIFLIESGLLGLTGGAIGVVIGLALSSGLSWAAVNLGGFELLQANYSPFLIFGALAFSFIIGSISGLMPAKQAAGLPPAEALRRG